MGEEADEVLTSTDATAEERSNYDEVVSKFDGFFRVRKNVIYERARFNRRCQLEGESVDEYITALYSLVETCEYGTLRDENVTRQNRGRYPGLRNVGKTSTRSRANVGKN